MNCVSITSKGTLGQSLQEPSWMTCLLLLLPAGCQPGLQVWVQAPPCSLPSTPWVPGQLRLLLALEEPQAPCCSLHWCHLHPPNPSHPGTGSHGSMATLRCKGTIAWERVMEEPWEITARDGGGVNRAATGHQPTSPSSEQIKEASSSHPSRDRLTATRARRSRKMKSPQDRITVKDG